MYIGDRRSPSSRLAAFMLRAFVYVAFGFLMTMIVSSFVEPKPRATTQEPTSDDDSESKNAVLASIAPPLPNGEGAGPVLALLRKREALRYVPPPEFDTSATAAAEEAALANEP